MEDRSVTHSTFVIERSYPVPIERVWAALSDPARRRRWYAEGGSREVLAFETDFRVGGRERTHTRFAEGSPFPGATLTNHTTYQDIVPNRRIVLAYTMSLNDHCFSASLATFELQATETGTNLVFTDQGAFFEHSDGPQLREQGWRKLLENLGVEVAR